ncbi:Ribonuclease H1 [Rhodosporidiobolus nylandii]
MAFYAVRAGREPGIYTTWEGCKAQLDGIGGCQYRSFPTRDEAEEYLAEIRATRDDSMEEEKAGKQTWWAVRTGRVPGVYLTWADCEAQVKGFPGARYRKFAARSTAEAYVAGREGVFVAGAGQKKGERSGEEQEEEWEGGRSRVTS